MVISTETLRHLDQVLVVVAIDAQRELRDLAVAARERGEVVNTAWFDQAVGDLRTRYEAALEAQIGAFARGLNRSLVYEAARLDGLLASGRELTSS